MLSSRNLSAARAAALSAEFRSAPSRAHACSVGASARILRWRERLPWHRSSGGGRQAPRSPPPATRSRYQRPPVPRHERTNTGSSATTTQITTALLGCFSVRIETSRAARSWFRVSALKRSIVNLLELGRPPRRPLSASRPAADAWRTPRRQARSRGKPIATPRRRVGDPKPEIEQGGVGAVAKAAALRRHAANRFPGIGTSLVGPARDPMAGLPENLEAPLRAD